MIRFVGTDGNMIAADIEGDIDGRAVLFLHGGGQTRHAWHGAQRVLAENGYLSISLDARGHGNSSWAKDGNYSIAAFADDVCKVIERLGRPVAIVGASLGGLTALVAMARNPALNCNAVVLVDVVPRPNVDGVAQIVAFMGAHRDGFANLEEARDAIASFLPNRVRPASTTGLSKNLRRADNGRFYWHWDPAYFDWLGDVLQYSKQLEQVIRDARVPLMLVRGLNSDVVTDAEVSVFRSHAPYASVIDVRDAGHMVAGDENDVFTSAIQGFLADHAPLEISAVKAR